jgi:hypothetical protein
VCVYSLSYPACRAHAPYYVVTYGLSGSNFFCQIISKRLDFRETVFNIRCVQINHQADATISQFVILTFVYSSTCFGRSPAHHQELNDCSGSLWFYLRIVVTIVLCSWSGRPAGTQHDCHHDTKVKPEAATAVIELLMMGGKTPETS